jgi:hypothetical protein
MNNANICSRLLHFSDPPSLFPLACVSRVFRAECKWYFFNALTMDQWERSDLRRLWFSPRPTYDTDINNTTDDDLKYCRFWCMYNDPGWNAVSPARSRRKEIADQLARVDVGTPPQVARRFLERLMRVGWLVLEDTLHVFPLVDYVLMCSPTDTCYWYLEKALPPAEASEISRRLLETDEFDVFGVLCKALRLRIARGDMDFIRWAYSTYTLKDLVTGDKEHNLRRQYGMMFTQACHQPSLEVVRLVHETRSQFITGYHTDGICGQGYIAACSAGYDKIVEYILVEIRHEMFIERRDLKQGFLRACIGDHAAVLELIHRQISSPGLLLNEIDVDTLIIASQQVLTGHKLHALEWLFLHYPEQVRTVYRAMKHTIPLPWQADYRLYEAC